MLPRALAALTACPLLLAVAACSPNGSGGGLGDAGITTDDGSATVTCNGGSITFTVDVPSCLWAPDHKMVLLTVNDIHATVSGNCALPTITIVGVSSNQPEGGCGSGNTSPDYTFNSTGVCLRAERDGESNTGRVYTITFEATDGNVTVTQSVDVTVDHSQCSDPKCAAVDPSRIVDDGDPRCN